MEIINKKRKPYIKVVPKHNITLLKKEVFVMDEGQVEFDMQFSTNSRINYLLWQCNQSQENDDPHSWFKNCKNIFKECSSKMKDVEEETHNSIMSEIDKALNNHNQYIMNYNNLSKGRNLVFSPPRNSYDLLFKWEMKLRKKLDKMGLLFKDKDTSAL